MDHVVLGLFEILTLQFLMFFISVRIINMFAKVVIAMIIYFFEESDRL